MPWQNHMFLPNTMPIKLSSPADCHFYLKIIQDLHLQLLTLGTLIFPRTVTKRNFKRQKRPKINQSLPLPPFYWCFSTYFDTKFNKSSTALLTRSRTNFNTKNTLFGHTRTKPAISFRKCPKQPNSSSKRSINQRTSFKTNNAPRRPSNACLPANPWNIFRQQTASSPLGLPRCTDIIFKNWLHLLTDWNLTRTLLSLPRLQTFGNSATQLTFFKDNNNLIPSRPIMVLSATFHHGHAISLTFGQNKSDTLICALVQQSTTWSS